jgi:hypothetical protein
MNLFKKFITKQESSYALGNIGEKYVKLGKIEYQGSLDKLFREDIDKFINQGIVYYDHNLDKSQKNKWKANILLEKVDLNQLPAYIVNNQDKYKYWIKN